MDANDVAVVSITVSGALGVIGLGSGWLQDVWRRRNDASIRKQQLARENEIWDRQRERDDAVWHKQQAVEAFSDFLQEMATTKARSAAISELRTQMAQRAPAGVPLTAEEIRINQQIKSNYDALQDQLANATKALNRLVLFATTEAYAAANGYMFACVRPDDTTHTYWLDELTRLMRIELGLPPRDPTNLAAVAKEIKIRVDRSRSKDEAQRQQKAGQDS